MSLFIVSIFNLLECCNETIQMYLGGLSCTISQSGPHGQSVTRFLKHEATKSIATFPLESMLVHCRVTRSSMSPVPIYTPQVIKRDNVKAKILV